MKNISAKKSLGQNFLKNKKVLEKIVEVSSLNKKDLVLEVGPGKGALTKKILETGAKVLVIEKDHRMIPLLKEKFEDEIKKNQLEIFEGDALEIDYEKLNLTKGNFKVIANLPYYITGKFLSNILSHDIQPEVLVLMLQKAVVERIVYKLSSLKAKKKDTFKENLLSLSVKVYGDPVFVMPVSAKNFSPIPKVDSAVLKVSNISKDFFLDFESIFAEQKSTNTKSRDFEKDFFGFLKDAFSSKRKKMIKNIVEKTSTKDSKKNTSPESTEKAVNRRCLEKIFKDLGLDIDSRAEDLSLKDFKYIYVKMFKCD